MTLHLSVRMFRFSSFKFCILLCLVITEFYFIFITIPLIPYSYGVEVFILQN
jgi:hypothetical protein